MSNVQLTMSGVSLHRLRLEVLSELAAKLVKAGTAAKEKSTKEMVSQLKAIAKEFNDAKTKEKTNQSTQLAQQYLEILKKRDTALGGCLTTACAADNKTVVFFGNNGASLLTVQRISQTMVKEIPVLVEPSLYDRFIMSFYKIMDGAVIGYQFLQFV